MKTTVLQHGRALGRRSLLALGMAVALLPGMATAHDFAGKPVRLVVGFAPGGSNDIVARIVAPRLSELLGTPVLVENRAGVSGMIGADHVAKSAPDGHTLLLASASPVVITPHTIARVPFNALTDLAPVNTVGLTPEAIAVAPSLGVKSLKELLALARTRPISLSSSGTGGLPHLTIELLLQASRSKIVHVPYKGAGPAMADTLAGHVDGIVMDVPPLFPLIQDKRLLALAVTSDKPVDFLPGVPTAQEELPGFNVTNWVGVFAPGKTPQPVLDALHAAFGKVVASEDVRAKLHKVAVVPSAMPSTQAFQQFVAGEFHRWGKLVKEKNIVAE